MEDPIKNGWFGGTTIFGNIHLAQRLYWNIAQIEILYLKNHRENTIFGMNKK